MAAAQKFSKSYSSLNFRWLFHRLLRPKSLALHAENTRVKTYVYNENFYNIYRRAILSLD